MFILNNFNNSTINTGANTNPTTSNTCSVGNNTKLNISLNAGTNNIINIKAADPSEASINLLLLNIPVLNIDFLLFM